MCNSSRPGPISESAAPKDGIKLGIKSIMANLPTLTSNLANYPGASNLIQVLRIRYICILINMIFM